MGVEGAIIFLHTDGDGEVIGVNGEMMSNVKGPSSPTFGAGVAIKAALDASRVPAAEHGGALQPAQAHGRSWPQGWQGSSRLDVYHPL